MRVGPGGLCVTQLRGRHSHCHRRAVSCWGVKKSHGVPVQQPYRLSGGGPRVGMCCACQDPCAAAGLVVGIRTADNQRRTPPPPPRPKGPSSEKTKFTVGRILWGFWFTNFRVPDPPPPALLSSNPSLHRLPLYSFWGAAQKATAQAQVSLRVWRPTLRVRMASQSLAAVLALSLHLLLSSALPSTPHRRTHGARSCFRRCDFG